MKDGVSFILLSGGVGSRSGCTEPKQFHKINGIEMIAYTLRVANNHPRVTEILINAPDGFADRTLALCARYAPDKKTVICVNGVDRQSSVKSLVEAASESVVLIHEAARPMIDCQMIDVLLNSTCENAGLFAPIPFSMCEVDDATGMVKRNIPRSTAFNIQLPQKFSRNVLVEAHRAAADRGLEYTEDAILVSEMVSARVQAIPGYVKNIKVTSPEDFGLVEKLMEKENHK